MFSDVPSGSITSPRGFLAGAVNAGIKPGDAPDLAILGSESPCTAVGLFTTNRVKSAPVLLSQQHISSGGTIQAVVANSGCANACVGPQGLADAAEMARLVGDKLGVASEQVLVASTGVIGVPLPMARVGAGIGAVRLDRDGGHAFATAIMTTDTTPKEVAVRINVEGTDLTIAGAAKGAGMIHPDMATMLCFLATDASAPAEFLRTALREAVDSSFNMLSIDGDTSPSDCVVMLANGMGGKRIAGSEAETVFVEALRETCTHLAKCIARDGEGATKLLEVSVEGAKGRTDARRAARTIASSALVKSALYGNDPNWGRIVAALGRSGAEVFEDRLEVYLNATCVMKEGQPVPFDKEEAMLSLMASDSIHARVCLNLGPASATAWGCDLSEEYVRINSEYTT